MFFIIILYFICCFSEWYERQSVMWCEEGVVISGLLMGLNAIDYNVHMKGEEFDRSVSYMWQHPLYDHTPYMVTPLMWPHPLCGHTPYVAALFIKLRILF